MAEARKRKARPYSELSETARKALNKSSIEYNKMHTKQICLRFFESDMELYEFAKSQPDSAGVYIKSLIRADMERRQ